MIKWFIILVFCFCHQAFAQHRLRIEVTIAPPVTTDSLFLTGNFNYWKIADPDHSFKNQNGVWVYEKEGLQRGVYEFKFSRGSYENVATEAEGNEVKRNLLQLVSDTTISYTLYYPHKSTDETAISSAKSANVHTDSLFKGGGSTLNIYLPPGYKNTTKRYPVIYIHNSGNLFESHLTDGEWEIDESLDSIIQTGKQAAIIVSIGNMPGELSYSADPERTRSYLEMITKRLKPYIDKKYRTITSKENTIIAGSDEGGYIAYYASLHYPDVFGRAGIFSPAFYPGTGVAQMTDSLAHRSRGMFFFYRGELEEGETEMEDIIYRLGRSSNALLYTVTDPDGGKNAKAWKKWFPEFYLWVLSNGLNHIIR